MKTFLSDMLDRLTINEYISFLYFIEAHQEFCECGFTGSTHANDTDFFVWLYGEIEMRKYFFFSISKRYIAKYYFALICTEYFCVLSINNRVRCLEYLIAFTCICCDFSKSLKDAADSPEPICEVTIVCIDDEKRRKNDFTTGCHIESKSSNNPIVYIGDDTQHS